MRIVCDRTENDVVAAADVEIVSGIVIRGRGNRLVLGPGVVVAPFVPAGQAGVPSGGSVDVAPSIVVEGSGNTLVLSAGVRFTMNLIVRGDGNRIEIGEAAQLNGFATVSSRDAVLTVGRDTTMVQGSLQLHEPGEIAIGEDCMIANQVYVSLSDIHPIHDRATGDRINPAASVKIGRHVWLGLRCMVMKGAQIGEGAVVAAGAVISGPVPPHAIVAGVPARVVRENIEWRRDFGDPARVGTPGSDGEL